MVKWIKNYFVNGEKSSESITRSAALIAVMGLASRFLGLFRDRILASKFGAGDVMDVYYAAFKIPDLVYGLLVLGVLSAAFVPVFSSLISQKKKKEAWELVNAILSIGATALIVISIVLFIFAPGLVSLIAFGFEESKQELVVILTRIMLLSPIFLGMSGIMGGILNSYKKFFFYSLAPIFYNVGIIVGAVFLVDTMGPAGLGWGVVLGAALHLLIQLPEVFRCGMRFKPSFSFKNIHLKQVGGLMIPRAMGLAVTQINFLIVTVLASTLESGSLAIFNFANNLQSVPMGLFGISFAVASFPILTSLWAQKKTDEFIIRFTNTFRKIIFFIIPLSAMIFVLRAQIVRVVLGTGRFDWEATHLTFEALGIFAFSLWAQSIIPLLARSFYAIHNTKIPFFTGVFSEVLNLTLALILIKEHGILGLVWAFTISTCVNAALLFVILRLKIGTFGVRSLVLFVGKIVLATFFSLIIAQIIKNLVGANPFGEERTFLGVFTQMIIALFGGLGTFVFVGRSLNIFELDHFISVAKNKLFAKKPLPEEQRDEVGGVG
ncbi:MAG: murein biosynthesis integral membrane protein MurJ [Patescibacteria group bacterium]|nr:murein biosynthesis integral membrane protein MurJ [Patescibacteria group bacterium]